jgi:hypothetical protein
VPSWPTRRRTVFPWPAHPRSPPLSTRATSPATPPSRRPFPREPHPHEIIAGPTDPSRPPRARRPNIRCDPDGAVCMTHPTPINVSQQASRLLCRGIHYRDAHRLQSTEIV